MACQNVESPNYVIDCYYAKGYVLINDILYYGDPSPSGAFEHYGTGIYIYIYSLASCMTCNAVRQ